MRYGLKKGNRLLIKDEVTDVLYICSAMRPFLLAGRGRESLFELKLCKDLPFHFCVLELISTPEFSAVMSDAS